jgi:hypothetical protein
LRCIGQKDRCPRLDPRPALHHAVVAIDNANPTVSTLIGCDMIITSP